MRQLVPVDARRQDWPRLVANRVNDQEVRLSAAESPSGGFSRAKLKFLSG